MRFQVCCTQVFMICDFSLFTTNSLVSRSPQNPTRCSAPKSWLDALAPRFAPPDGRAPSALCSRSTLRPPRPSAGCTRRTAPVPFAAEPAPVAGRALAAEHPPVMQPGPTAPLPNSLPELPYPYDARFSAMQPCADSAPDQRASSILPQSLAPEKCASRPRLQERPARSFVVRPATRQAAHSGSPPTAAPRPPSRLPALTQSRPATPLAATSPCVPDDPVPGSASPARSSPSCG